MHGDRASVSIEAVRLLRTGQPFISTTGLEIFNKGRWGKSAVPSL